MDDFEKILQQKIDLKTKPLGALGFLENLAFKIGKAQESLEPKLNNPHLIVFAGDHGIAEEGVSAYPSEVTEQMVLNFLNDGAAINVFCKQNGLELKIVDAGVKGDLPPNPKLISCKIGKGTKNFLNGPAMTPDELDQCFEHAEKLIKDIHGQGCNIVGFGEMGIANTSSASMLVHYLSPMSLEQAVGRGTGMDDEGLKHKLDILNQAADFHGKVCSTKEVLQTFAGFEIAQMTGAMLAAFEQNMLILVDGFIASAAFLAASKIEPRIFDKAIFCHQSDEHGHKMLLDFFNERPILNLNLRLGEGTGCALAYPIIQAAVNFLNEMASFDSAGVSNKSDQ